MLVWSMKCSLKGLHRTANADLRGRYKSALSIISVSLQQRGAIAHCCIADIWIMSLSHYKHKRALPPVAFGEGGALVLPRLPGKRPEWHLTRFLLKDEIFLISRFVSWKPGTYLDPADLSLFASLFAASLCDIERLKATNNI